MDLREKREANRCAIDEFNRVKRAKLDRELAKPIPTVVDPKADKKRDRERANRASAAASRAKLIFYSKELERRTDRLEMERNAEYERANRACKKLSTLRDEVCTLRKVLRQLWDLKDQKVCAYLIDSDALFLLSRRRDEDDEATDADAGAGSSGGPATSPDRADDDEAVLSADSEDGTKSGFVAGRLGHNDESLPRALTPPSDPLRARPSLPPPPPPPPPSVSHPSLLLGLQAVAGQKRQLESMSQQEYGPASQKPRLGLAPVHLSPPRLSPQAQAQSQEKPQVQTQQTPNSSESHVQREQLQQDAHVIEQSPRPSSTLHSLLHPPQDSLWFDTRAGLPAQQAGIPQRGVRRCMDGAGLKPGATGRTEIVVGGMAGAKQGASDWWVMRGTRGE